MKKNKKVYIGMSGGVDSSVSAYLLKKDGYDVTGVFIKVWQPDFIPCTWREDRLDAMRVAAQLGIPFLTLDLEKEYKKGVIDYMIEEYRLGRTPNPDVFCNKEVKFGAFLDWAIKNGADYIATGHYARIKNNKLLKGKDDSKDQSYFLWAIENKELSKILFPIGELKKEEVRKIAKKNNILTAEKKDSQGLCFVSNLNMKQFLSHFIDQKEGKVLNENGDLLGFHKGAVFHTLGERLGFKILKNESESKPYYVISKDVSKNEITVSHVPQKNTKSKKDFYLKNENFFNKTRINFETKSQIRYHGEELNCQVSLQGKSKVTFSKPTIISPGQSIVFYDREVCVGGAIID